MKLIAEGAEARVFLDGGRIVKDRVPKSYRIREIDERLRKFRTRREAKVFNELEKIGLDVPRLLSHSDRDMRLEMEFLDGKKLRDVLNRDNCRTLGREIGKKIGMMHMNGIIHADLTPSNMILCNNKVFFIDFGLSFFSAKPEDKAVDLHLLRQALEGRNHLIWRECLDAVIEGYMKSYPGYKPVLARLEKVESRGRHKGKAAAKEYYF
ncbi:Kae1-associated serine/threonine protein kinase [Candidatus Woesearchaeota archaeon]|nr:Kae1-associated serine/threonine protein kinase [Candidatus Woesearchaeota archaeon]